MIETDSALKLIMSNAKTESSDEIINGALHRFRMAGSTRAGYLFKIGKITDKTIIICEGCGEVLHKATGLAVVMAFNAYNLVYVTGFIRSKYPDITIILAADDDYNDEENPGMAEATEAALCYDCLLAVPSFKDHKYKFSFYCMAVEQGLDAVRQAVEAASIPQERRV